MKPAIAAPPVYRPVPPAPIMRAPIVPARVQARVPRPVVPRATGVQAKFSPDEAFRGDAKLMAAYDLFNSAIDRMPGLSNVARLRSSASVNVVFTAAPMSESKAHSSIDVPDPYKDGALCPLFSVAQYHNLIGSTEMEVTMNMNSGSDRPFFLLARTLAHEIAGHIAPYTDILEKIKAGQGMSGDDRDRITGAGAGGCIEHAGMVGGHNAEYDTLVKLMASQLTLAEGLQMADDYLKDISRYHSTSGKVFSAEERAEFSRQFQEARQGIAWIAELEAAAARFRRNRAIQRRNRNILLTIILIAIVGFVLNQMFGS